MFFKPQLRCMAREFANLQPLPRIFDPGPNAVPYNDCDNRARVVRGMPGRVADPRPDRLSRMLKVYAVGQPVTTMLCFSLASTSGRKPSSRTTVPRQAVV